MSAHRRHPGLVPGSTMHQGLSETLWPGHPARRTTANAVLADILQRTKLRSMDRDWLVLLQQRLVGGRCSVRRRDADWALNFATGGNVSLPIPWRIVADGRILFANEDDGQQFGLPDPIDGEALANRLLGGKAIVGVTVDPETADLSLLFDNGTRVDAFNHSAGYEGWQVNLPLESGGISVIALGGGGVRYFA